MLNALLGKFSKDIGIDLGSAATKVYVEGRGIVIQEPSVVALNTRTDQIVAIGKNAEKMYGKTPPHMSVVRPIVNGVISDFEVTEKMLIHFIGKVHEQSFTFLPRPRVVIGIPLDSTEVERKAVEDILLSAGAREVILIEKPMATAIGARLPIHESIGSMVVDFGAGKTEIAIISLGGVVTWKSHAIAGDEQNAMIIQYVREHFNLLIGEQVAEDVKTRIGSAVELPEPLSMHVRGRDLLNGLPREITLTDGEVREALQRSLRAMIEDIKATIEVTPPELVADIYERGMILAGGGAMLRGMDKAIAKATEIPIRVADDPTTCVVRGTGIILEAPQEYQDIIIPSARGEAAYRS